MSRVFDFIKNLIDSSIRNFTRKIIRRLVLCHNSHNNNPNELNIIIWSLIQINVDDDRIRYSADNMQTILLPTSQNDNDEKTTENQLKLYHEIVQSCSEVNETKQNDKCPICLESFNFTKEIINEFRCGHLLHNKCLNSFIYHIISDGRKVNCPMCRENLF